MSPYRVGYVGVEHHHRDPYFTIAAELPVDIVAVCEPGTPIGPDDLRPMEDRPDEITEGGQAALEVAQRAEFYADPAEMIDSEDLDLLWITYSNQETPEIVEHAVNAGLHVISEKPIARTASELASIANKAEDRGVSVVPTYFYRANPIVRELRHRVQDGFFGDIWAIQGRFIGSQLSYRDTSHYIYDAGTSRGGVLQWIGVHWLDLMRHVLDSPIQRVNASMAPARVTDVEEGAVVHFETATGTMGTFHTGYYLEGTGKDTDLSLYGTAAQAWSPVHHDATMNTPHAPLRILSRRAGWESAPERTIEYEFAYDTFPAWGDYVYRFFERSIDGLATNEPLADISDAIAVLDILDAAYASVDAEGWVTVSSR